MKKMKNITLVMLLSLALNLIMVVALIHMPTNDSVIPKQDNRLWIGYYNLLALDYISKVNECVHEDSIKQDTVMIYARLDSLNEYIEGHHDLVNENIQEFIYDDLCELQETYDLDLGMEWYINR